MEAFEAMGYGTWTEKEKERHILLGYINDWEHTLNYHKEQVEKYQKLVDDKKAELLALEAI